jgi:hypothetical protein
MTLDKKCIDIIRMTVLPPVSEAMFRAGFGGKEAKGLF